MTSRKPRQETPTKAHPVSLAPLSFEEAVRALAATPPITEKPHHQPKTRAPKTLKSRNARRQAKAHLMRRSSWYALLTVAVAGCGIAGILSFALVSMVGWLGILIIGLSICLVAIRAELDADAPAMSVTLLRRQYEQTFEGTREERVARWAERVERNRLLYIARTIGIATVLIGPNMFIVHQL